MKCEICHQHDATTAYTHIVDDEKKTLLLCDTCMSQENVQAQSQQNTAPAKKGQQVPALVQEVKVKFTSMTGAETLPGKECVECGMTYEQFKKAGRLGCHHCYEAFAPQMQRLLKRIHGADKHCGKEQIELGEILLPEEELALLQQELQEAVARENFERAVQVRDQIRRVESTANGGECR